MKVGPYSSYILPYNSRYFSTYFNNRLILGMYPSNTLSSNTDPMPGPPISANTNTDRSNTNVVFTFIMHSEKETGT